MLGNQVRPERENGENYQLNAPCFIGKKFSLSSSPGKKCHGRADIFFVFYIAIFLYVTFLPYDLTGFKVIKQSVNLYS